MFNKCKGPIYILLIIVLIIFAYNGVMMLFFKEFYSEKDFLNVMPIRSKRLSYTGKFLPWESEKYVQCCSYWPLSHFLLFFLVSFIYPDCWKLLFIGGVSWEVVESLLGALPIFPNKIKLDTVQKSQYSEQWWYGNYIDIAANSLGILTGVALNKLSN